MTRTTVKGRASGWPGVVEGETDGASWRCVVCGATHDNPHALFDHVAYRHPLLVKGESAQR